MMDAVHARQACAPYASFVRVCACTFWLLLPLWQHASKQGCSWARVEATETVSLTAEQATGEDKIELDFTQFQNVRVISIFVDDNQGGGDVTNVSKIIVNGHPVHTTNMSELKKC